MIILLKNIYCSTDSLNNRHLRRNYFQSTPKRAPNEKNLQAFSRLENDFKKTEFL